MDALYLQALQTLFKKWNSWVMVRSKDEKKIARTHATDTSEISPPTC